MACQRLKLPSDDYDKIATDCAVKLIKMYPQQQLLARRPLMILYLRDKWEPYSVIFTPLFHHIQCSVSACTGSQ